ncbi:unnamed protein product, partial [Chrysoparadoxa australica]
AIIIPPYTFGYSGSEYVVTVSTGVDGAAYDSTVITIVEGALTANVEGPSSLSLGFSQDLVLDGSATIDEDQLDAALAPITYDWSCSLIDGGACNLG